MPDAALRGMVLYVEDADVNALVVEGGLDCFPGARFIRAATGKHGVRLVRSKQSDFVLLDMHLTDEIAARRLRVTHLNAEVPAVDLIKAMNLGAFDTGSSGSTSASYGRGCGGR